VGRPGENSWPQGPDAQPENRTVTFDVAKAVQEVKAGKGRIPHRQNRAGACARGQDFVYPPGKLIENATVVITSVIKAKPSVAKGKYIKGCT